MVALHVRRLHEEDWPLYRRLRREAVADPSAAFATSAWHECGRDERYWRARLGTSYTVGAFVDDDAVGFGAGELPTALPRAANLRDLWVAEPVRGLAIPSADGPSAADVLLLVLCGWARQQGRGVAQLVVATGVPEARDLALRHGFAPTGKRCAIAGPVPRIGLLYACDLGDLGHPEHPRPKRLADFGQGDSRGHSTPPSRRAQLVAVGPG